MNASGTQSLLKKDRNMVHFGFQTHLIDRGAKWKLNWREKEEVGWKLTRVSESLGAVCHSERWDQKGARSLGPRFNTLVAQPTCPLLPWAECGLSRTMVTHKGWGRGSKRPELRSHWRISSPSVLSWTSGWGLAARGNTTDFLWTGRTPHLCASWQVRTRGQQLPFSVSWTLAPSFISTDSAV